MSRIFWYIITTVFWRLIFNQIPRTDFVTLINNFRVQHLAVSFRNLFNSFWGLISNNVPTNNILRYLTVVNIEYLTDTRSKKFFWLGFISFLIIYKQYILFKRFLLWPFKLGIFSFVFSTIGIDTSWFLGLFNIFPLNIPQWVYLQYLILYNNWLNWWKNIGQIKNLSNVSVNKIPSVNKSLRDFDLDENTLKDNSENKIFNKINLIILFSIIAIAGLGIWYYYYNNGTGTGGNTNTNIPPAGGIPPVIPTDNVGGLTEAQRIQALVDIENLRLSGMISMADYDNMRDRFLPTLPVYECPIEAPTDNVAESSTSQVRGSTTRVSPTEPLSNVAESSSSNSRPRTHVTRSSPPFSNPVVEQEINLYFPHPEGSTSQGGGSTTTSLIRSGSPDSPSVSNNPLLSSEGSSSSGSSSSNERPSLLPESSSSTNIERSASPTLSDDSSDTIIYGDPKGKAKIMMPRRD